MSTGSWTRSDHRTAQRIPIIPRMIPRRFLSLRTLLLALVLAAVCGLGWLWYRGSSFVKITHVTVTGLSGPDVPQIRTALTDAALRMTTLNVSASQLEATVSSYPAVHSLTVTTIGSHAARIEVNEQIPVAELSLGGQDVMVDGYGQLLRESTVPHSVLPALEVSGTPSGNLITAPDALAALKVLRAAPYSLLGHVQSAAWSAAHGVVLALRNGPELYFGPASQLRAKWVAVEAVLADSSSAGAAYIDVSDPQLPAAGVPLTSTTSTTSTTSALSSAPGSSASTTGLPGG